MHLVQGFLALLGYAAIARTAAFQFLGGTTSLAAAAFLGLTMDLSGLLFMFAHRMLACSYAAACQAHAQTTQPVTGEDVNDKKQIRVPQSLATVGHIFMSEQPAIPTAQVCVY